MRRTLAWIAGLAGIAALGRWASRRRDGGRHRAPEPPSARAPGAGAADPADELRARLSEQRETETDAATAPAPSATGETIEERRARVHAKALTAIDEMREPDA